MSVMTRMKAIFAKPEYALGSILPELRQLRADLRRAQGQEPLDGILTFFRAVSPWHDRGLADVITAFNESNYGQHDKVLGELRLLQEHFEDAGRDMSGYNRTRPCESVTVDNIFLGDIFGLWTKPLRYWPSVKDKPKGGWMYATKYFEGRNSYDVVADQAAIFISPHIREMCYLIGEIETVAR